MMNTIRSNIESMISNLETMAIYFYQQKNKEATEMLEPIFEQLGNTMDEIAYLIKENPTLPIHIDDLNQALNQAMQALQAKDTVLFSDIMNYDFLEQLRVLVKAM